MEWNHSTWNPPGMWGQGKLLLESTELYFLSLAEVRWSPGGKGGGQKSTAQGGGPMYKGVATFATTFINSPSL